jgi:hypothetical protein
MRFAHVLLVAAVLLSFGVFPASVRGDQIEIDTDSFAAIAYSPSTGEFGYAHSYEDRESAEKAALDACSPKDARIVCWINNGFCALALGDDKSAWGVGYEYAGGASNTDAMATAVAECKKRTTGAHVALCLSSDGQYVHKPKRRTVAKSDADSDAARSKKTKDDARETADKPKS